MGTQNTWRERNLRQVEFFEKRLPRLYDSVKRQAEESQDYGLQNRLLAMYPEVSVALDFLECGTPGCLEAAENLCGRLRLMGGTVT